VGTLTRMRRRGVTVILGALITALLAVGVMAAPMPYVVLQPGPTVNTLGSDNGKEVIQVTEPGAGITTSASAGQLRLTTVQVKSQVELVWAIQGWFSDEQAVVPRDLIYPPDQSEQQVEQHNAEEFKVSQSSAETVALRKLGYPVQVTITKVVAGGPSQDVLKTGDVITSVDGTAVTAVGSLSQLVQTKAAGTALKVDYTRDGTRASTTITSRASAADEPPRIGVEVKAEQPHPFKLVIDLEEIGGPSAGLMFTLGIIDKLRPEDLTGGKIIAGTGTIDDVGTVGPIGGIPQKLVGAKDAGAQIFLVPADNCAEALQHAVPGLPMAKVTTVDDALTALKTWTAGGTPTPCTAS
jgi:PDZ domain-containing protein